MTIAEVADLLDNTARALRELDAGTLKLDVADTSPRLDTLNGYNRLPARIHHLFRNRRRYGNGEPILSVNDLCSLTASELLEMPNFGPITLAKLVAFMDNNGIRLKGD